ncbi:MAG: nucleotide exchange factor GrpE [Bryobacteraceae bacterium]|nr:nucleotide exchange factor GrpE [Bryobacteraceae bacterium]
MSLDDPLYQLTALTEERDRLLLERNDLQDRLARRAAEFDNYRKRIERERADMAQYAGMNTVGDLLPVLDDFQRAVRVETADREYAKGIELIHQRFSEVLKKLGLEPIVTEGQLFDPNLHQAIDMVESETEPDQTILAEYAAGYNFKGKMLRPAMVKVAVRK